MYGALGIATKEGKLLIGWDPKNILFNFEILIGGDFSFVLDVMKDKMGA